MLSRLIDPAHSANVIAMASSVDPVTWLVNYGVAGIVIALLVTGQLRTKSEVQQLTKLAEDRLVQITNKDAALVALTQQITSHTLPQLVQATKIFEEMPQNTEVELVKRLEALTRKIEDIERGGV